MNRMTTRRFLIALFSNVFAMLCLPFLIAIVVFVVPVSDARLSEGALRISRLVPGLGETFYNLQQFQSRSDASKFVLAQFYGFSVQSILAILSAIGWSLAVRVFNGGNLKEARTGKDDGSDSDRNRRRLRAEALVFVVLLSMFLIFYFLPVAYVPAAGTAPGKAYWGSLGMAALLNSLWGIFLFMWLCSILGGRR